MRQLLPEALLVLTIVSSLQLTVLAEENRYSMDTISASNDPLVTKPKIPIEIRYYTDFYKGDTNHKMLIEIVLKETNKTVHCRPVGHRLPIHLLLEDINENNVSGALSTVMPKAFVRVQNVSTEEVDNLIDECIKKPLAESKPFAYRFMVKVIPGYKKLRDYYFHFPGTKWCGAGNIARNSNDLGPQKATDECCRAHDQSQDVLQARQTVTLDGYNLTNPLSYTMTNCDDDRRLWKCLRDTRSSHAAAFGNLYFNIMNTKCFAKRYKATCVKRYPLSPCLEYSYDNSTSKTFQIFDPIQFTARKNVIVDMILDVLTKEDEETKILIDLFG